MWHILFLFLFSATVDSSIYEYDLSDFASRCSSSYDTAWDFCPILLIPYEVKNKNNLPSVFSGQIIEYNDRGLIWENDRRDSSYIAIEIHKGKSSIYKIFWFVKF
jgi:hypothetical protein